MKCCILNEDQQAGSSSSYGPDSFANQHTNLQGPHAHEAFFLFECSLAKGREGGSKGRKEGCNQEYKQQIYQRVNLHASEMNSFSLTNKLTRPKKMMKHPRSAYATCSGAVSKTIGDGMSFFLFFYVFAFSGYINRSFSIFCRRERVSCCC